MSNDIFDFFGGSSSRKLEPLDESEMFDDLLPAEPEAAAESIAEDDSREDDVRLTDSGSDPQHAEEPARSIPESGFSGSHWDELASSLGLELPPAPTRKHETSTESSVAGKKAEFKKSPPKSRGADSDRGAKSDSRNENRNRGAKGSPPPKRKVEEIDSRREPVTDTLSSIDANDGGPSFADPLDDDPFAAFSGSSQTPTREKPQDEPPEPELPQLEILDEDDIDMIDSDFVEFEVQDLKGSRGGDRERRPRRGNRGGRDNDSVAEQTRPAPENAERKTEEEGRSRRRRSRGRGRGGSEREAAAPATERPVADGRSSEWHAENDLLEPHGSDDREQVQPDAVRREPVGRGSESSGRTRSDRDRGRGNRENEKSGTDVANQADAEIDREDDDWEAGNDKKKVRIPTWDDAIGGVVEQNIKRHNSSKSPRGGSRRRRS